jgi:hypothetical protein
VDARPLASFSGDELKAVASLWKRERRELTTSFSGVSMLPTIAPGTPLVIACGDEARSGDVIIFIHRGQPVVHRLLSFSRNGRWMLARGDANAIPDLPIARDALVGRVTAIAGGPVLQQRETAGRALARRIASAALAIGAVPARLLIGLMWRIWGANVKAVTTVRLYGASGFLARVWSHTIGAVLDVDVLYTGRFTAPPAFTPVEGYRYERVRAGSPRFDQAVRMLGSDASKRAHYEAFVAIDERDGTLAACTFADALDGPLAFNRGGAADPRHRGKSLTPSLLQYQAWSLAQEGAREVEYHVSATNRGARRMHRKIGAREHDRWIILVLFRRFRFARRSVFATARQPNPS